MVSEWLVGLSMVVLVFWTRQTKNTRLCLDLTQIRFWVWISTLQRAMSSLSVMMLLLDFGTSMVVVMIKLSNSRVPSTSQFASPAIQLYQSSLVVSNQESWEYSTLKRHVSPKLSLNLTKYPFRLLHTHLAVIFSWLAPKTVVLHCIMPIDSIFQPKWCTLSLRHNLCMWHFRLQ